jgi:glc operon protein GlcG
MRARHAILLALALFVPAAAAQELDGSLTAAQARTVMEAATAYARAHGAPGGAIAIVDAGGALVLFERLPGSFPAASRVAVGKAFTAATFRKPTKAFEDAINGGRHSMTALPDFYPLQGGVPLVRNGVVVGAIGVSGAASAAQDEEIATAGAGAFSTAKVESVVPPADRDGDVPVGITQRQGGAAGDDRPAVTAADERAARGGSRGDRAPRIADAVVDLRTEEGAASRSSRSTTALPDRTSRRAARRTARTICCRAPVSPGSTTPGGR